eukprot:CAMPEP_0202713180 /NCGR_PEP_ID=MMETSP1385-20130828/51150_1 /ASSEMBLY_ACC=CAM_ASM_000861 /TAXON_ID=933848 /ORGANISM="Elphidium margaritaceum" /LENGTH=947 /DNA_ID=CAMNT_0049373449 /DNA_START=33 /DNA_END=2876 /DNA_ORIENTATION=+
MAARESAADFVQWFQETATKNDKLLRIFDRGPHYTVFGEQSEYIAEQFYRSRKYIASYGDDPALSCVHFRQQMLDSIVNDYVLNQKKTVEIYEKAADGSWSVKPDGVFNASTHSSGSVGESEYTLCCVYMHIQKQMRTLGVAFVNHSNLDFKICHFIEDSQYTKLAALCSANGIQQCIFQCASAKAHMDEVDKFHQFLRKSNVSLVEVEDTKFWSSLVNNESQQSMVIGEVLTADASKWLHSLQNTHTDREDKHALRFARIALAALVMHSSLSKNECTLHRYKLSQFNMHSMMRISPSSFAALNLFPSSSPASSASVPVAASSAASSLYDVLKHCKSTMGDRLLSIWIRQPLLDIDVLHRRQKLVKLFVENEEHRQCLRDEHLASLIDLEGFVNKLVKNRLKLKDLVDLYYFVGRIGFVRSTLSEMHDVAFDDGDDEADAGNEDDDCKRASTSSSALDILKSEFAQPMIEMDTNFNNYLAMIEEVVDLRAVKESREYLVRHEFDALLDKYDKKKSKLQTQMEACRDDTLHVLGVDEKTLQLQKHKSYGYCLRITKASRSALKKHSGDFNKLSDQKSATLFTDERLQQLSKEMRETERKYMERQTSILAKLFEITKTYISVIEHAQLVFSEIDVLLCLAHCAAHADSTWTLPKLVRSHRPRQIVMKNARHPCLEQVLVDRGVVANDVDMIESQSTFQVITGPNMGGKSTYIRMIGVLVLMAQMGSYVPCDRYECSIVDAILSRVGAGDNQLRGISTFMAEMLESSYILQAATQNSLVIIDELGRGTSTYDGFGIAYAISEKLIAEKHSFTLFATHFHELSVLASKYACCINRHVTAHVDDKASTLTMLYKMHGGSCPQSFGIQVAKLAKFPHNVIASAQTKVEQLEKAQNTKLSLSAHHTIQSIVRKYEELNTGDSNGEPRKAFKKYVEQQIGENAELAQMVAKLQQL